LLRLLDIASGAALYLLARNVPRVYLVIVALAVIIRLMDKHIVERLIDLNRQFYSSFATEFSNSRRSERINMDPILAYFRDGVKILDVGCGNGRLAERIDRDGLRVEYLGIDAARELIAIAAKHRANLQNVRAEFRICDITQESWFREFADKSFDIIIAFAALHHIPSYDLRQKILQEIRQLLAARGTLIMTNWQFDRNERLRKKIVPWSAVEIDERTVETGDALISWQRGGVGYRYCHLIHEDEVEEMAKSVGFRIVKQFYGDADLNLYSILVPE